MAKNKWHYQVYSHLHFIWAQCQGQWLNVPFSQSPQTVPTKHPLLLVTIEYDCSSIACIM
eukprot:850233-Amphidinium_carterae.1